MLPGFCAKIHQLLVSRASRCAGLHFFISWLSHIQPSVRQNGILDFVSKIRPWISAVRSVPLKHKFLEVVLHIITPNELHVCQADEADRDVVHYIAVELIEAVFGSLHSRVKFCRCVHN